MNRNGHSVITIEDGVEEVVDSVSVSLCFFLFLLWWRTISPECRRADRLAWCFSFVDEDILVMLGRSNAGEVCNFER